MDNLYITGDLVYIHGSLRIISNCDGYYATYYDENENLQEVNVNVIEGIPLSPEILENNGWKKKMYCDWCHYLPIEGNILYLSKGIGIDGAFSVDVGQDMSYIASIRFVHQLQHIFFSLNINNKMEV